MVAVKYAFMGSRMRERWLGRCVSRTWIRASWSSRREACLLVVVAWGSSMDFVTLVYLATRLCRCGLEIRASLVVDVVKDAVKARGPL